MAFTVLKCVDRALNPFLKRTNQKVCPYILYSYIFLSLLAGCASGTNISDLYQYRFTMMHPPTGTLSFEDDNLRFSFQPKRERIDLAIENKGSKAVELNWDAVEFEDRYGAIHKVTAQSVSALGGLAAKAAASPVAKDVKSEKKDKPSEAPQAAVAPLASKVAIVIDPGTRLETWIVPSDYVKRLKNKPLFPELKTGFDVDSWDRTTFKLFIPLKMGEEKKNYRFAFRIRID